MSLHDVSIEMPSVEKKMQIVSTSNKTLKSHANEKHNCSNTVKAL
jgi:hypothetical protein